MGTPWAFLASALIIIAWALSGPAFGFSSTWQLIINTGTTIVTFLMVFIIQNTQNRDARAIHVKLDELIHAFEQTHDDIVDIEDASEEELAEREREFREMRQRAASGAGR
jgi:low affinity Fe/Cu permease